MPIHPDGTWYPEAWVKTNIELQDEAKELNAEAFDVAFAGAGKHSQPSAMPNTRAIY